MQKYESVTKAERFSVVQVRSLSPPIPPFPITRRPYQGFRTRTRRSGCPAPTSPPLILAFSAAAVALPSAAQSRIDGCRAPLMPGGNSLTYQQATVLRHGFWWATSGDGIKGGNYRSRIRCNSNCSGRFVGRRAYIILERTFNGACDWIRCSFADVRAVWDDGCSAAVTLGTK